MEKGQKEESRDDDVFVDPTSDDVDAEGRRTDAQDLESFRSRWQSELNQRQNLNAGSSNSNGNNPQNENQKSNQKIKRDAKSLRRVSFAEDAKPCPGPSSTSVPASAHDKVVPTEPFKVAEKKLGVWNSGPSMASKREEDAKNWFEEGVIYEQAGKLCEAVNCYRKATQLVPDIEYKLYKRMAPKLVANPGTDATNDNLTDDNDGNNNSTTGFIELFTKLCINDDNNFVLCSPDFPSFDADADELEDANDINMDKLRASRLASHISSLPFEVLIHILKFAVFGRYENIDLKCLESVSLTCRGFYILARDEEIWKRACIKIWGQKVATNNNQILSVYDNSWRQVYIFKPRVNYFGVYISKTTYIRQGESSFLDKLASEYRPVHMVEYYRYLRFFPNGVCLMITSPDEPTICIPKLREQLYQRSYETLNDNQDADIIKQYMESVDKDQTPTTDNNKSQASVIQGVYKLQDSASLFAVFKKITIDNDLNANSGGGKSRRARSGRLINQIRTERLFKIELNIKSTKNKVNNLLTWKSYVIEYEKSTAGVRVVSHFDTVTQPNKYPPFYYSRVKSY